MLRRLLLSALILGSTAATAQAQTATFVRAQRLLDRGHAAKARQALERFLAGDPDAEERVQARFLWGISLIETGAFERAERVFRELLTTYPALADDHLYYRGLALARWGSHAEAADVLVSIDPQSLRYEHAQTLRARSLYAATRFRDLAEWLGPDEENLPPELGYYLAVAARRTGSPEIAARILRTTWQEAPAAWYSRKALEELQTLRTAKGPVLDARERRAVRKALSAWQRKKPAVSLHRLEKFATAARARRLGAEAAYARARYYDARGRYAKAAALFRRARRNAPQSEDSLIGRATLAEGRVLQQVGHSDRALAVLEAFADAYPEAEGAEEALFRSAEILLATRRLERAGERFQAILLRNPVSAHRDRCNWGLGWVAFRTGRYDQARRFFQAVVRAGLSADADAAARYWLARTEASTGAVERARERFREVLAKYPLSYYGALASDQLLEVLPRGTSLGDVASPGPADHPGLEEIAERIRIGLRRQAYVMLSRFEFDQLSGAKKPDAATLVAMARLYDRLGRNLKARKVRELYLREYPSTGGADILKAAQRAHPLHFESEINRAADEFDLPRALVFALVRTESAFRATAISSQAAHGLAQLLLPTAREVAKRLRVRRVTRSRLLRDPALNVRLGAAYLRGMLDEFEGSEPLALAAYNAGPGAVKSWSFYRVRPLDGSRRRAGVGLSPAPDELVEEIPVAETKRYVKAVLARARVYERLYARPEPIAEPQPLGQAAVLSEPAEFTVRPTPETLVGVEVHHAPALLTGGHPRDALHPRLGNLGKIQDNP